MLPVPRRLAPRQQVRLPGPEQRQVPGQRSAGRLHVRRRLLQRQRQPAQLGRQFQRAAWSIVPGPGGQEPRRHVRVQHRDLHRPPRRPVLALGGDQHPPRSRRAAGTPPPTPGPARYRTPPATPTANGPVTACTAATGSRASTEVPRAQLRRQHRELRRQHRRVFGRELPAHPDLAQLPVRVLHRHAGLARTSQTAQHRDPRPGMPRTRRQPAVQLRQQRLAAGPDAGRGASRTGRPAASGRRWYSSVPIAVPPRWPLPTPGPASPRVRLRLRRARHRRVWRVWRFATLGCHIAVDHPGRRSPARRGDVHVPPGGDRVARRPTPHPRAAGGDIIHQGTQPLRHGRVLIQQVSEPARPPLRRRLLRLLHRPGARGGQLLAGSAPATPPPPPFCAHHRGRAAARTGPAPTPTHRSPQPPPPSARPTPPAAAIHRTRHRTPPRSAYPRAHCPTTSRLALMNLHNR